MNFFKLLFLGGMVTSLIHPLCATESTLEIEHQETSKKRRIIPSDLESFYRCPPEVRGEIYKHSQTSLGTLRLVCRKFSTEINSHPEKFYWNLTHETNLEEFLEFKDYSLKPTKVVINGEENDKGKKNPFFEPALTGRIVIKDGFNPFVFYQHCNILKITHFPYQIETFEKVDKDYLSTKKVFPKKIFYLIKGEPHLNSNCTSIEFLNFNILNIISHNITLTDLTIHNFDLDNIELNQFLRIISLKNLNLSHNNIYVLGWEIDELNLCEIEDLNLSHNKLYESPLMKFPISVLRKLKNISFASNRMGNERGMLNIYCLKAMLEDIILNTPYLENLDLRDNVFTQENKDFLIQKNKEVEQQSGRKINLIF